jgi:hypothetical protein
MFFIWISALRSTKTNHLLSSNTVVCIKTTFLDIFSMCAGVVERASKELSRRLSSLAARTRRGSTQKHERLIEIPESER